MVPAEILNDHHPGVEDMVFQMEVTEDMSDRKPIDWDVLEYVMSHSGARLHCFTSPRKYIFLSNFERL